MTDSSISMIFAELETEVEALHSSLSRLYSFTQDISYAIDEIIAKSREVHAKMNSLSAPQAGIPESLFYGVGAFSDCLRTVIRLSHDLELVVSLEHLDKYIKEDFSFSEAVKIDLGGIVLEAKAIAPPSALYAQASDSRIPERRLDKSSLGVDLLLGVWADHTLLGNLDLGLSFYMVAEKGGNSVLIFPSAACQYGRINDMAHSLYTIAYPVYTEIEIEILLSQAMNDLSNKLLSKMPFIISLPRVENEVTGNVTFYSSMLNNRRAASFYALRGVQRLDRLAYDTYSMPSWGKIGIKLINDYIYDTIDRYLRNEDISRTGQYEINQDNQISFPVRFEYEASDKILGIRFSLKVVQPAKVRLQLCALPSGEVEVRMRDLDFGEPKTSTDPVDIGSVWGFKDLLEIIVIRERKKKVKGLKSKRLPPLEIVESSTMMSIALTSNLAYIFIKP